jgi:hypothetical protein
VILQADEAVPIWPEAISACDVLPRGWSAAGLSGITREGRGVNTDMPAETLAADPRFRY